MDEGRGTRRRRIHASRVLAAALLGALCSFLIAGMALSQSLTGGCSATVNGRSPQQLTKDSPLVVAEGDSVTLQGTAPAGAASGRSTTRVKVETPFWMPDMSFGPYKGKGTSWGGTVEVPKILFTLASGIYKVNGTGTGSGWRCTGSGYVQLGDAALAEAAIGAGAALGAGAAARGARKPPGGPVQDGNDPRVNKNREGKALVGMIRDLVRDLKAEFGADAALVVALIILFLILEISGVRT